MSFWGESPDAQTGLTSGEEGGDGGVFVRDYAKVKGNWPIMVEVLRMLECGEVEPEDVELPSAPILLEGGGREHEEDKRKLLERCEVLKSLSVLPLVVIEGGDLVSDLISVLVHLVDVVGEGGVLREEVDDKLEGVGLEGVL